MDGRTCKKCGGWTPTEKLWNRRGWICNVCAAKHPRFRFRTYKGRAAKADIAFSLTFDQFMVHWQQPCSYCAEPIETIGLDRVDNSRGYEPPNIIPCCSFCNALKGSGTQAEFIARCVRIASIHPEAT